MKKKVILLLSGGIVLLLPVLFVAAYEVRGAQAGTVTPTHVSACPTLPQITYPPLPTLSPAERMTPNAEGTIIARYHATYPVSIYDHVPVRDLAPQVPFAKKSPVIVRHADCSYEELLIPFDQAATYINALPASDTFVVGAPPPEAYHPPVAPETPIPRPGQTPGVVYGKDGKPITVTITPPGGQPSPPSSALQTNIAHDVGTFASGNQTAFAKQTASAAPQRTPTP